MPKIHGPPYITLETRAVVNIWRYYLDNSWEYPEDVEFLNNLDKIGDENEEHANASGE